MHVFAVVCCVGEGDVAVLSGKERQRDREGERGGRDLWEKATWQHSEREREREREREKERKREEPEVV